MMNWISVRDVNMTSLNAAAPSRQSIAFRFVLLIFLVAIESARTEKLCANVTCLPAPRAPQPTDQSSSVVDHINWTIAKNVSHLDASRKNLTSLKDPEFRAWYTHLDASKVILLNLSANHLDVLVERGFAGFASLKCLDVAHNKVRLIQDNAFSDLEGLMHLNLSGNRLAVLQDETFRGLVSLQQLDLSFNNLSTIAPGCLELPTLTRLEIAGNGHLGNGKASLFLATGKRLQSMDATGIGVGQMPSALTHSIRTLRLADNQISSISRGEMDTYPLLQLLDLTRNQLVDVEEDALGRLEMLTILYLTRNDLTSIPHSLPEKLKILHLEQNRIEVLRPGDLEGLDQLEVLLLNENRIKTITNGAFQQMTALVSLDLSLNPFTELPTGMLAGPLALRVLRLGHLNVSMPSGAKETAFPLLATEHLITLDVRSSPALARQWLADIAALAAARELQELDLSSCGIQNLPIDLLHYLPQLRSLHLIGNELNCTDLEWLAEWMRRQEIGEYRDVYCQSPADLWGTLLIDLQNLQETIADKASTKSYPSSDTTTETTSISAASSVANNHFAFTSTPLPGAPLSNSHQRDNYVKKTSNLFAEKQYGIQEAKTWPRAIKAAMMTSTSASQIPISPSDEDLIQASSRRNLFMKNSSAQDETKSHKTFPTNAKLARPPLREDKMIETTGGSSFLVTVPPSEEHEATKIKPMSLVTNNLEKLPDEDASRFWNPHPGMYLLVIGVMGVVMVLIILSAQISRRRGDSEPEELRVFRMDQSSDLIEVTSLPSVTELW